MQQLDIPQIVININEEGLSILRNGEVFIDTFTQGKQQGVGIVIIASNLNSEKNAPIFAFKSGDKAILKILKEKISEIIS
jgi:hypothetical protein